MGCIGSFWYATNGLLQGNPLSVVILNCVLCPLVNRLSTMEDLSVYAFADDLTVVSTSWDTLALAYAMLCQFSTSTDLRLNLSKCQLWNKGNPYGHYPPDFDQFTFCFYPFLLGSPIDVGVSYDASLSSTDKAVLLRAQRTAKLPLPYVVSYRLFTSLVSSCYNHVALSCDISSSQNASLKHAITSILVPKRSKWVCREALFSLVTPGHLLSPHLFLNYRHVIEYLLYVRHTDARQRTHLSQLWYDTLHLKWGPFFRLRSATKHLVFFEDPFVLIIQNAAYSVDDDFCVLKHTIRDSYRNYHMFASMVQSWRVVLSVVHVELLYIYTHYIVFYIYRVWHLCILCTFFIYVIYLHIIYGTWKWQPGIGDSFWRPSSLGSMLNSGWVYYIWMFPKIVGFLPNHPF